MMATCVPLTAQEQNILRQHHVSPEMLSLGHVSLRQLEQWGVPIVLTL